MISHARVLIVEDETDLARMVRMNLQRQGYDVDSVASGQAALATLTYRHPDVIVLDLGLPDIDGMNIISKVRALGATTRIVVLSARGQRQDKIAALDAGADDYLTKPFDMGELLARLRVAFRHLGPPSSAGVLAFGALTVDFNACAVTLAGRAIKLTRTEWALLRTLVAAGNRTLSREQLLRTIWGQLCLDEEHYLHVYVASLRKKLEPDPHRPRYIVTVPGVGYRFAGELAPGSPPSEHCA
jgi:two-component system KDP operon response regulator KdpE